jgi:nucleotide-binding universal stress UspA family protein
MEKRFLRKILVPVDGSDSSLAAEETAATIAKKTKAAITVLHVIQELTVGASVPDNIMEEIMGHFEQKAGQIIRDAEALFGEEKIPMETQLSRWSDPADKIVDLAHSYDLIVMGARGENEKDEFALGSVTKKVIRHATCPTLIVKNVCPVSKLLMCVDGSENSIKALEYALKLAENMKAKITVLHVQERRLYDFSSKTAKEVGEKILSKALSTVKEEKVKIDKMLEFGVPSDKIVEVAEKDKFDLIVLGSRGLGKVERFLLGSVSDDVSLKAKCSVLIVPTKR